MFIRGILRGFDPRAFEKPGEGNPGDGGTPGDPGQGGEDPPPGAGEAGGEDPPPAKSSIMDFAPKGDAPKPGEEWKLPDGIEIPDHLRGTSAEDTLSKLSKAYAGARAELSKGGQKPSEEIGEIPDDPEKYEITGEDPDDPIFKDLTSEESKPIVDAWRAAAKEAGLGTKQFDAFMKMGMKNMVEGGLQIETDPEKAAQVNGEAEMKALEEQLGKSGADLALRQLDSFAVKLANKGILSNQEDVNEFSQMVGTARAAQIMQRIIVGEFGEQAIPPGDGVDGVPTLEEAYAAKDAALRMPPGSERDHAIQMAEQKLSRVMKEGSTTGSIRSKVL